MPILAMNITGTLLSCQFFDGKSKLGEKRKAIIENPHHDLKGLLRKIGDLGSTECIAYKLFFGGNKYRHPKEVNGEFLENIKKYYGEYGLENCLDLTLLGVLYSYLPSIRIITAFDSSFFQDINPALSAPFVADGLTNLISIDPGGINGILHEEVLNLSSKRLNIPREKINIISCCLDKFVSITAIKNGMARENSSSMGINEGLPGLYNSGSIGSSLYVELLKANLQEKRTNKINRDELDMSIEEVNRLLTEESGLIGHSGAKDPYHFFELCKNDERASLISEVFIEKLVRIIGGYIFSLKRIDAICFTGELLETFPALKEILVRNIKKIIKIKVLTFVLDEDIVLAGKIQKYVEEKADRTIYSI